MNQFIGLYTGGLDFKEALNKLISSQGSELILSYGYISSGEHVLSFFNEIKGFLSRDRTNKLSIYVGANLSNARETEEELKDISKSFLKLIPREFASVWGSRIDVVVVNGLHAKFAIIKQNSKALAAIMGSSNLSNFTLNNTARIELDLFMTGGTKNEVLREFEFATDLLLKKSKEKGDSFRGKVIQDRIKWQANEQNKEFEDRALYKGMIDSEEMGLAILESDIDQEICSDHEFQKALLSRKKDELI